MASNNWAISLYWVSLPSSGLKLPWAGSGAAAQRNLVAVTGELVLVAQILGALVAVQDGRGWMFVESVEQCSVRQLTDVAHPQTPTHNLPRLEVEHHFQVMPAMLKPQVSEVLHPTTRIHHSGVAQAVLWPALVAVVGEAFQGIWCSQYFGCSRDPIAFLLARSGNLDIS